MSSPSPSQSNTALPDTEAAAKSDDSKVAQQTSEPLAPPPRPIQNNPTETPDYFSGLHNGSGNVEFNPFEQSFGAPSAETPGKSLLPPVAALASPAIPGTSSTTGFNWPNSLRSGPLSPAMLAGPQAAGGDYFDSVGRGFPTPNESSLRTGLTPGGGGSMFPAPSPGSQALFQQLQSGGATPGTLDFHRTAMTAAARTRTGQVITSNVPDSSAPDNMDVKQDPFAHHDATDAANGLFMLAKGGPTNSQYAMQNQQQSQMKSNQASKPNTRNNGSLGSIDHSATGESPESLEESSRPNTRGGRAKKTAKAEAAATNNRRKSEATPKGGNKRAKSNSGVANVDPNLEPHDEDMDSEEDDDQPMENGKKMTDEEKRKNFLERNRVAALKCRQRKKQWLANLQAKVEMYSAENDTLNTQVAQLHDEVRSLRSLLMSHKDCPIGHQQGLGNYLNGAADMSGFANQHVNPFGMAMPNGAMQPGMQRS